MYKENEMNDRLISFIIPVTNEQYLSECLFYISKLVIPEEYSIDICEVYDAKSMTSAYNEAMQGNEAKYKIYMHQDVFLFNTSFLVELISAFTSRPDIGMIGVLGGCDIPQNGICYNAWNVGNVYANNSERSIHIQHNEQNYLAEVEAIDGMLIATQYDLPWREDIFKNWDFYDVSQAFEFRRKGYRIGVLNSQVTWCMHDCGHSKLRDYYHECRLLRNEYKDFLSGVSSHQGEEIDESNELVDSVIHKAQEYFMLNIDEMRHLLDEAKLKSFRNTKLVQTKMLYEMRAEDIGTYGYWKWGSDLNSFEEALDKYFIWRFLIWRIELGYEDVNCPNLAIEGNAISNENWNRLVEAVSLGKCE